MTKLWQPKVTSKEVTWAEEMSRKLANGLVRKKLVRRMPRIKGWIKTFGLMLSQDKLQEEEVSSALDWYLAHIGDDYVPDIRSASAFRAKYQQLQKQTKRAIYVPLDSDATAIWDQLKNKGWPGGLEQYMPSVIQKSLNEYHKFWKKVKWYRLPESGEVWHNNPLIRLLKFLLDVYALSEPKHFVLHWAARLHDELSAKDSWVVDPAQLVWSPTNFRFERAMFSHSYAYCGDSGRWSLLREEILKRGDV